MSKGTGLEGTEAYQFIKSPKEFLTIFSSHNESDFAGIFRGGWRGPASWSVGLGGRTWGLRKPWFSQGLPRAWCVVSLGLRLSLLEFQGPREVGMVKEWLKKRRVDVGMVLVVVDFRSCFLASWSRDGPALSSIGRQ